MHITLCVELGHFILAFNTYLGSYCAQLSVILVLVLAADLHFTYCMT